MKQLLLFLLCGLFSITTFAHCPVGGEAESPPGIECLFNVDQLTEANVTPVAILLDTGPAYVTDNTSKEVTEYSDLYVLPDAQYIPTGQYRKVPGWNTLLSVTPISRSMNTFKPPLRE